MKTKQSILAPVIRLTATTVVLCGLVYPALVTVVAQVTMPDRADGSLIYNDQNEVIGSALIGQNFKEPRYFQGRVSSIAYKSEASGSNNYAPSNPELLTRTEESLKQWEENNPTGPVSQVPIDLVTNSGSGLDPHISPAAARAQIDRVAKYTGLTKADLQDLIQEQTEPLELGLFGTEKVNVLKLNIALQKLMK
jgi:K+-transporting ATPase ATPase C chain